MKSNAFEQWRQDRPGHKWKDEVSTPTQLMTACWWAYLFLIICLGVSMRHHRGTLKNSEWLNFCCVDIDIWLHCILRKWHILFSRVYGPEENPLEMHGTCRGDIPNMIKLLLWTWCKGEIGIWSVKIKLKKSNTSSHMRYPVNMCKILILFVKLRRRYASNKLPEGNGTSRNTSQSQKFLATSGNLSTSLVSSNSKQGKATKSW